MVASPVPKPWLYSNDEWTPAIVDDFYGRLEVHERDPTRSAMLSIGVGLIPYALGKVSVYSVHSCDLHKTVTAFADARHEVAANSEVLAGWNGFKNRYIEWLMSDGARRNEDPEETYNNTQDFKVELVRALESGIAADFAEMVTAARKVTMYQHVGDICDTTTTIAARLRAARQQLVVVNFSNAARYMADGATDGRTALAKVLYELPVADDAVIIDSTGSTSLTPVLYTPHEYVAMAEP